MDDREAAIRIAPTRTEDELARWVELHNRASPCRPEGLTQLRHYWDLAPEWRSVIAWRGDRPVGAAHVELQHWVPDSTRADVVVVVPGEERRRGVGAALFAEVSQWASKRGLDGLEVWLYQDEPDGLAFWTHRGYREVGRERISHADLRTLDPEPADPPAGVELVTLEGREDLERGMYPVGSDGIADIPGPDTYAAGDFDHWRSGELHVPGLMPGCSVVALANGEVIGFATVVRMEANPDFAWHEMTAVARDWRGRGVARALKRRTIELARAAGLHVLESMNEARNASILAVNARLGYRHVTDVLQMHGPLA